MSKNILTATVVGLCMFVGPANAQLFDKTVPAGRTTQVFVYKPQKGCRPVTAVATLADKPQHGRVTHTLIDTTMAKWNRFTGQRTGCEGQPVKGFAVTYTPAPGFQGSDSFSLDVDFKENGRREVDVFRIHVVP